MLIVIHTNCGGNGAHRCSVNSRSRMRFYDIGGESGANPQLTRGFGIGDVSDFTDDDPATNSYRLVTPQANRVQWAGPGAHLLDVQPAAHVLLGPQPDADAEHRVQHLALGRFPGDRHHQPGRADAPRRVLPEAALLGGTRDPRLSSDDGTGPHEKVVMWSYPVIQDGLIYTVDLRNGLYILKYKGPYAGEVDNKVRQSSDSGKTWNEVGSFGAAPMDFVAGPQGELYAYLHGGKVARSTDGGGRWQAGYCVGVPFERYSDGAEPVRGERIGRLHEEQQRRRTR